MLCMATAILGATMLAPASPVPAMPDASPGIYIDGHLLDPHRDSLVVTAKGTMKLTSAEGKMKFRLVLRHRTIAQGMPILQIDERYLDFKELDEVNVDDILGKMKPGDQLLLLPVTETGTAETIILNIAPDRC